MKYFFSGNMGRVGEEEERLSRVIECRLCSCHDNYVTHARRWCTLASQPDTSIRELMLDSGAFTAWTKGHVVGVDHLLKIYGELVTKYSPYVQIWLINLDVIPGSPGRTAGAAEIVEAIRQSDRNFEILTKEFGDIVLPVFHQNESEERLRDVCNMAEYICVSPRNDLPEKNRVTWAEYVHRLCPGKKTHGLATTGRKMMSRVPWRSVDSASWLYSAAMGKVEFLVDGKIQRLDVSQESPSRHEYGKHFDNCPIEMREVLESRAGYHGITMEKLQIDHMARKLFNGLELAEMLKSFKTTAVPQQQGLFSL